MAVITGRGKRVGGKDFTIYLNKENYNVPFKTFPIFV